jgi:hypothetical protein
VVIHQSSVRRDSSPSMFVVWGVRQCMLESSPEAHMDPISGTRTNIPHNTYTHHTQARTHHVVRREQHVVHAPERVVPGQGLHVKHVQARTAQSAVGQRLPCVCVCEAQTMHRSCITPAYIHEARSGARGCGWDIL